MSKILGAIGTGLVITLLSLVLGLIAAAIGSRFSKKETAEDRMGAGLAGGMYFAGTVVVSWALMAFAAWSHEFPGEVHRFRDGDTFEGEIYFPRFTGDFRLYCIDTPESFGAEKSAEGVASSELVKGLKLRRGHFEIAKRGTFRDYLVWFRPEGWKITLNEWLWKRGAPLYDGLTRYEKRLCLERLGERP